MKTNRTELIRARVEPTEKKKVQQAANLLHMKDSELMRLAINEFIKQHLPLLVA